jgi:hypothetical protein
MPTWATLLVALLGSAAGAAAATIVARMRMSFEREESLRGRMLDAADDYSSSVSRASNALHRTIHLLEPEDLRFENGLFDQAEIARLNASCDEARPLVDEARNHFARTQLLFGADTPAGRAALSLISKLSMIVVVTHDDADLESAREIFNESTLAHRTFTLEARRALLRPSLHDPDDAMTVELEAMHEELAESQAAERGRPKLESSSSAAKLLQLVSGRHRGRP